MIYLYKIRKYYLYEIFLYTALKELRILFQSQIEQLNHIMIIVIGSVSY